MQGGSLYHFYDGLWYDPAGRRTTVWEPDTLTTKPTRHGALGRNPRAGYNTLHLRIFPRYFLSACPHRQFHTLPGFLDSHVAWSNSYPMCQVGRQFVPFLWWSLVWPSQGANLPHERQTRLTLSQPEAVEENLKSSSSFQRYHIHFLYVMCNHTIH